MWSERKTGRETVRGGTDSDRNCPGLSPGLLTGRVCASLSACLSSPLLSILLKTICLLIIHRLLFWTDMFSLHRYFHRNWNVVFPPKEQEVSKPAHEAYFKKNNISWRETFFILGDTVIWYGQTKQMTRMCFISMTKKADTVTALPTSRGHSSHISIAFTSNFNFL